jgi:hypothetical protein
MRYWRRFCMTLPWVAVAFVTSTCSSTASTPREVPGTVTAQPPKAVTAQAPMTCMPKPSACGFPDVTNTGVTPGTPLTTASGEVKLDQPGEVYQNVQLTGGITVTAQNVTIRNVRLVITDPYYGIRVTPGDDWGRNDANLTLDHVEINMNGSTSLKGIAFNGYTAKNVLFHNGADCAHMGENVVIQDSMCVLGPDTDGDGVPDSRGFCNGSDHFDGFQSDGGQNITIRHNTIRNPCGQTSAILMSTNTAPIDSVVIDNNLMSGGGYTVYCGTDSGGVATHETYTNNVISKEFFPKGGYWGPTTSCEHVQTAGNNVWDGDYVPPPGAGGSGAGAPGGGAPPAPSAQTSAYLLTGHDATRLAGLALRRAFGHRYTHRLKRGSRLRCHRLARSTLSCAAAWTGPRIHGTRHRYAGTLRLQRTAAKRVRAGLRVRDRVGSRRGKLVSATRTLAG